MDWRSVQEPLAFQQPGCQQFEVFQSALAPDKLVVRELWDDQAALDTHAQRNATRPAAALGAGGPPR